tara:strand:- start:1339 stop:2601 length:1263 start_codon:yes stop_codon:yes gene_type:complete
MPNAEIISIGSELLLGQIVDTNSAWMAQRLSEQGINLFYKTIVGDNPTRMNEVLDQALDRADLVITGGGLGPTQDDLTREAIADVTGRKLVTSNDLLSQLENRFQKRGMVMTKNNQRQARIPTGAIPVHNPNGTAPAFIVEDSRGTIFALPGVPFELKWLFDNEVLPYLKNIFNLNETIFYKVLKVSELGESRVDDLIGHLIAESSNPTVGVLAHPGQVDIRIAAKASSTKEAIDMITPIESEINDLLGRHVFASDEETIEMIVGNLLMKNSLSVSVFENVTGGTLANRLLKASSSQFDTGLIGNRDKVTKALITNHKQLDNDSIGNIPLEQLTCELAKSIQKYGKSDIGLALYAVLEKGESNTVQNLGKGQTYIAVTDGSHYKQKTYPFAGRGAPDQNRMSFNAMDLLRVALLEGFQSS